MGHRLGIRSKLQQVCSITLGSQAITPLDLTTVYATFAARGVYHAPQAIALARGPQGKVVGQLQTKGTRVLSPNTADLVTYALQGVIQHGTGTGANFGRPEAGKTGTAENYQDAWFCGYVPQLATCVWVGYPKARDPAARRRGLRQRLRRLAARVDLARVHVAGGGAAAGRSASRRRRASTARTSAAPAPTAGRRRPSSSSSG